MVVHEKYSDCKHLINVVIKNRHIINIIPIEGCVSTEKFGPQHIVRLRGK